MTQELFTGKAESYATSRPDYPEAVMDYIETLVSPDATFADIGAGTGIFTRLIAARGYRVYALEPNPDMSSQLEKALRSYPRVTIVAATAEATTLPERSIDVITSAQAMHWFDLNAFRRECLRIGKSDAIAISVYNVTPGGNSVGLSQRSSLAFFHEPVVGDFPNPISFTRERWLHYMTSHSHDPLPSDEGYAAHIAQANAIFDHDNIGGVLTRNVVTTVFSEHLRTGRDGSGGAQGT